MLQREAIEPATLELLRYIQSLEVFSELRLVGGTALALQIGHRKSIDLDFFGKVEFENINITTIFPEKFIIKSLKKTININIFHINNIKVDFVNYPYPWIDNYIMEEGVILGSMKDIAAMKVAAITNRGTKKDFIDLFFLLKYFTINEIILFYKQKYKDASEFLALKSLSYFGDAEKEPLPEMLTDFSWQKAKETIVMELKKLT